MTDLLPKCTYSRRKKREHFFNNLFNLTPNAAAYRSSSGRIPSPPADSSPRFPPRRQRAAHSLWLVLLSPVLISLRRHGGDADLIIVMVAGGSHPLHTSATASYLRSSRFTTGQPRALLLLNPTRHHLHLGFLSNYNHMRCKFFGELHGPFGSGSKTFSQRTTR